jgi:antitoxin CptB
MLRFWNNEVLGETESVLEKILQVITPSGEAPSHSTRPPQNGSQVAGYPPPLSHEGRGEKCLDRIRWRCRRGLLELDIVLGRFIEQSYPSLDNEQRVVFDELLDLADNDLWDLITGKKEPALAHSREVLDWLKAV